MGKIYFFFIIFSLAFLQADLIQGLIGYWQFEDSGLIAHDSSPDSLYPGYLKPTNSPPTFTTNAKVGTGALYFDGVNDYVEIAMPNAMQTLGELTISMWFNWELGNVGTWQDLMSSTYSGNNQFWWRIKEDGSEYSMYTNSGNSTLLSSVVPAPGIWHHTAFVYKHATKESKMYLNPIQVNKILFF